MIVRIQGEGQFEVADSDLPRINELDAAVEAHLNGPGFSDALAALLEHIRTVGLPVADESLLGSAVVLPAADASAEEVRALLAQDGLIPD